MKQHRSKPAEPETLIECKGLFGSSDGNTCFVSPGAIEVYEKLMGDARSEPVLARPQLKLVSKRAKANA